MKAIGVAIPWLCQCLDLTLLPSLCRAFLLASPRYFRPPWRIQSPATRRNTTCKCFDTTCASWNAAHEVALTPCIISFCYKCICVQYRLLITAHHLQNCADGVRLFSRPMSEVFWWRVHSCTHRCCTFETAISGPRRPRRSTCAIDRIWQPQWWRETVPDGPHVAQKILTLIISTMFLHYFISLSASDSVTTQ